MPSETTTACVRLLVFFRIRRSTFPYVVEDDASTISQTPTTHYTSTCVKLTIVIYLSFRERIAIANLSLYNNVVVVVVFTLKTVLTSIQYPSLSYSSRQRNEFPWSHANPK